MSLPMLSGSCWTKRTTESNRTAPEILRGFFAPYPPADASCRTSGHTPPNPLTADLPVTQAQTHTPQPSSPLSSPSQDSPFPHGSSIQALLPPKQNPLHPTLPYHAGTDPHDPATQPAILAAHQFPHSRMALLSKPCFPQSEARHAPHFPTTQAQTHTTQPPSPLSSPLTSSPIPAHLSSPTDLYKNPGSRPPPGFFVISGSVRSPSQRRLR